MRNMEFSVFSSVLLALAMILTKVKSSSDVPAILWNIKGNALDIKPVSAFEVSTTKILDNLLKESKSDALLVFLMDELSLEDLSSEPPALSDTDLQHLGEFLDIHPHMLLPRVQNPLKHLRNVHCGKEELHLGGKIDERSLQSVSTAMNSACVVILDLQNSEIAETGRTKVDVAKDVLSSLSTSKKNVVGMFTATKSSWTSSEHQHKSRSLLAQDTNMAAASSDNHFLNYNNCTIMYATNISVTEEEEEGPGTSPSTVYVPFTNIDLSESICNSTGPTILVLKFGGVESYPILIVSMSFERKRSSWILQESELTIKNETESKEHKEMTKPSYAMEAPMSFSYSCGKLILETFNSTTKYCITMEGFQIQPYDVKKLAFAESFDCVPFFTLPIWMGLIVGILFIIILNTGVYALFAVKTMDRFDDPKGKTISVAFSAD